MFDDEHIIYNTRLFPNVNTDPEFPGNEWEYKRAIRERGRVTTTTTGEGSPAGEAVTSMTAETVRKYKT